MFTQRYMSQYGATEEDFGRHVVTQRYHASMNDDAIFRDEMTLDDYLAARYVSKPLRILDCDYPVDSGSAVIFTTEERLRLDQPVAPIVQASTRSATSTSRSCRTRSTPPCRPRRSSGGHRLMLADVDTAQFTTASIIVFQWLEALGFAVRVRRARRRRGQHPPRRSPVNTDGVQRRSASRRQLLHRGDPSAARQTASVRSTAPRSCVHQRGRPLRPPAPSASI
jgi:acetyl-CoA acetyltransferase